MFHVKHTAHFHREQTMNNTQLETAEKLFMACQFDRAFPLFEELAEENNSRALFFLGVLHGHGLGHVKRDQEKSLTALEKSAVTGEPGAWVELASLLYRRAEEIVAVDETLNHRILEKATAGDVISQYELGVLCINGWGVEQDIEGGSMWLKRAADAGFFMAMDDLGVLYKERALGKGKEKDAWSYFLRAAGLGYRGGEFHLGECYYEGIGVEPDLEKAVTCYKRALAHGSMEAADALGTMAVLGEGMPVDEKAAFTYFRTAVKGGYIASLYKLGDCYYYGRGTAQDFGRARDLFEKAWDNGDKAAAVRMGTIYLSGLGVEQDSRKAVNWFTQSAESGDPDGIFYLGECAWYGEGMAEDKKKAISLYVDAAEGGQEQAMTRLGQIALEEGNSEEAVQWFTRAATLGFTTAENFLAICYYKGAGVPRNEKTAREWLDRSENQGDAEAPLIKQNLWGITPGSFKQ